MRRSSVITIIFLVLIIIGLSVSLIFTNLPQKDTERENDSTIGSDVVNVEDNSNNQEEKPELVSLDGEIANKITRIVRNRDRDMWFYKLKFGKVELDDLTNEQKLVVAFFNYIEPKLGITEGYFTITKADMDAAMLDTFGIKEYTSESFSPALAQCKYNSENETYDGFTGLGGGGPGGIRYINGIYKIEEYSDRYEAYAKSLVMNNEFLDDRNLCSNIYPWDASMIDSKLGEFMVDGYNNGKYNIMSQEDFIKDVELKKFAKMPITKYGGNSEFTETLLSKYFEEASEYKHTFMKNEDGGFYWVKSEIIK